MILILFHKDEPFCKEWISNSTGTYIVWFQMYKDLTNRYESAKKTQSEMRQDVHNLRKVWL